MRRAPAQRPCRRLGLGHYAQTPTARPHRGSEVGGGWASRIRVGELPSHLVPYGSAMGLPWWVSQQGSLRRMQEIQVRYLGQEDPLEKEMATQPSIPAWDPMDRGAWQTTVSIITTLCLSKKRREGLPTSEPPGPCKVETLERRACEAERPPQEAQPPRSNLKSS